jgi:hypothetical protein
MASVSLVHIHTYKENDIDILVCENAIKLYDTLLSDNNWKQVVSEWWTKSWSWRYCVWWEMNHFSLKVMEFCVYKILNYIQYKRPNICIIVCSEHWDTKYVDFKNNIFSFDSMLFEDDNDIVDEFLKTIKI